MKKLNIVLRCGYLGVLIALELAILLAITGCNGGGGDDPPPFQMMYTVSGTFQAPDTALIDSDVNDPNAPYISNDTIDEPQQEVPNPGTIGGYVNVPDAGASGRSQVSGDISDFFEVALADGQAINLFIADHPGSDLDLYLYDAGQTQVGSSMGTDSTESLTVSTGAGTYFIEVSVFSGASNYSLTIGQSGASAGMQSLRLEDDFVPGEVIVRFTEDHKLTRGVYNAAGLAASVGLYARAGAPDREMLLAFDDEIDRQRAFQALNIDPTVVKHRNYRTAAALIQRKMDTLYIVKALRQRPEVVSADLNYIRQATLAPNDPQYGRQWHYPLINLPQAWDIETGDNAVIVAVIDTGVLLSHPDLAGRLTANGYDFIRDPAIAVDNESLPGSPPDDDIDPNPDDPGDQSPGGSSFHGTHVTGTIAAATDNNTGVAGVTWNTLIMPLRALGRGGGTSYDVMQCVKYAAGLPNDSGTIPSPIADVMNLSLGGGGFSQTEQNVFTEVHDIQGVIVIAAAGNESSSSPSYPAAYDNVISVSAVNFNKGLAWYSNFGSKIDVAAPGGDTSADLNADGFPDGVLSACGDDTSGPSILFTYCFFQGTSMASPHMAGVVALMKAVDPTMKPVNLDQWLASGLITEDLGVTGRDDQFGWGLIDAFKAVLAVGGPLPALLVANPASINFAPSANDIALDLTNEGGSSTTLTITNITTNEPWLTVTPTITPPGIDLTPADPPAIFTVTVNRALLTVGLHDAEITITSDAANDPVKIPVSVQEGTFFVGGNAGFHYVLMSDPDTLQTRYQVEVGYNLATGVYSYAFTGVRSGTYQIFAGTDSDNDFWLG
ncbi:MAG: S8 family serine peptidase, partial [Planctomycetota bacterium]